MPYLPLLNEGDDVKYDGSGRPYLKDLPGKIVALNVNQTSALVEFAKTDGSSYKEWVGLGALLKVQKAEKSANSAEEILRQELRDVTSRFNTVQTEYRQLNTRKNQLENALRALNATL